LTIGKIARMVGGKGGLPKPVASSGFPKGLMVSSKSIGKMLHMYKISYNHCY